MKHIAMFKLFLIIISGIFLFAGCNQYYSNQNIEIKEDGLIYKVGQENPYTGRIIDTLSNNVLEYEVVNGMKNGEFRLSSIEGAISVYGKIENNRNIGEWKYYYPNGQLESIGNFKYDNPHGKWNWYFPDGNIREIGTFFNGKKQGKWYKYSRDGLLKSITMYDADEKTNEVKLNNFKNV
jgi:antitoxin component YwqK of YwqJK toxin-antitoxin module